MAPGSGASPTSAQLSRHARLRVDAGARSAWDDGRSLSTTHGHARKIAHTAEPQSASHTGLSEHVAWVFGACHASTTTRSIAPCGIPLVRTARPRRSRQARVSSFEWIWFDFGNRKHGSTQKFIAGIGPWYDHPLEVRRWTKHGRCVSVKTGATARPTRLASRFRWTPSFWPVLERLDPDNNRRTEL